MDISLTQFTKVAQSNWFNNDIVLSKDGQSITSKFFHTKSSNPAAQVTNTATMNAFRTALQAEFGSHGLDAFDALQEKRGGHSLRKSDVLNTIKLAKSMRDENFKGITTMNALHTELRHVFGRYGQEAFQEMKRTNLDDVVNDKIIKNTIKLAQEKKTAAGNELRTAVNTSLDQIFADQQRPYHKLPAGLRSQLRSAVMTKMEDWLQMDDVRQMLFRDIREYEVKQNKDPQFPGGMDFHTSHAIQDAAKALGRPDLVKADPIFNTEKKYNPNFNPMHAHAEPIGEGWVNVSLSAKEEIKDINLIRGGLRGLAELALTNAFKEDAVLSKASKGAQDFNRKLGMDALDERLKDDALVIKIYNSYEKDPKTLESYMFQLAMFPDSPDNEKVLIGDDAEVKADHVEEESVLNHSVEEDDVEPRPRAETTVAQPRTILHGLHRSNSVSDLNP